MAHNKNPFYGKKRWLIKRSNVLKRDEYKCRECLRYGKTSPAEMVHHIYPLEHYPQYSLTDINLLSLCNSCHGKMHDRNNNSITTFGVAWQRRIERDIDIIDKDAIDTDIVNQVSVDTDVTESDIIDTFGVVVVWGSPASGKTTYVKQHMQKGDMVVDLDYIKQAISLQGKTASTDNLLPVALDLRNYIYDLISRRDIIETDTVWVVAGLPNYEDREEIKRKLRPNAMIYINSTLERCIEQAMGDKERGDKDLQVKIIHKWYENYTEAPPPYTVTS